MIAKDLSYEQLAQNIDKIALLPTGSLEQHGPLLPLGTDAIIAEKVAEEVEKQIPDKVILFPTIYYGCSKEHANFPGTVFFEFDTYIQLIKQIVKSLYSAGFKKVIIPGGHGGNHLVLQLIQSDLNYENNDNKLIYHFVFSNNVQKKASKIFGEMEEHAGSVETSVVYSISPRYIKTNKDSVSNPDFKQKFKNTFNLYNTKQMCELGVIAPTDTVNISKGKGGKIFDEMVRETKKLVISTMNSKKQI